MRKDKFSKSVFSWCLYDWANSAFITVIVTFVFATYFTKAIAPNEIMGTALWGNAMAIAAIFVAITAPIIGAISDQMGRRKPWLFFFTALSIIATSLLWYALPDDAYILWALGCVIIATIGFEIGMVFYNAMLPEIIKPEHIGRVSGWAWGLGFYGGLAALLLCLVGFVQTDQPWFGLTTDQSENIRAIPILVAIWFGLFSLPLFFFTPDKPATGIRFSMAIRNGLGNLIATFKQARQYRQILKYLFARMIYTDGLNTLFAFGGIYAAGTFGMELSEVIQFGIALNVTAGLGAFAFAWMDDKRGSKTVIVISLTALTILGSAMLVVEDKTLFWIIGLGLGIFIGPVQAASRTLMARITPQDMRAEFFGLYALSGKATAFLGPFILGALTLTFDSQRIGMATIVAFFAIGLALLIPLKLNETPASKP